MKTILFGLFILVTTKAFGGGKEVKFKDLPELKLPLTETQMVEDYSRKIGAFEGTDGFKANFWCRKLAKPKRAGAYFTSLDCKLISIE